MLWILIISFIFIAIFIGNPTRKKRNFDENYKRKKNRKKFK